MDAFWHWWQTLPHHIDPVLLQIGSFKLQYYGLMYILAFATTYLLVIYRLRTEPRFDLTTGQVQDLLTAMVLGLLIGARLGYVVFYNLAYYLEHPLEIVLPFARVDGALRFTGIAGMSYHGGLIGLMVAGGIYLRRNPVNFWLAADLFAPAAPLGYTFGRLGNFINGELYGRVTQAVIGMDFPKAPGSGLRHPSQLYEAFFEGLVLFAILWRLRRRPAPCGAMLAYYLMGYGVFRFGIEFFRQPDDQLGFVVGHFSMGQLLCSAMIVGGFGLLLILRQRDRRKGGC